MHALPQWDGDLASALAAQATLAGQLRIRDGFVQPLRTIAGIATDGIGDPSTVRASIALLDADSLAVIAALAVTCAAPMPILAGLRSFRELPAVLEALSTLPMQPDLLLVDGHGIDHPGGLGLAAHVGLAADLPSIGATMSALIGTSKSLHEMRGAFAPLRDGDGRQIGWILRSRPGEDALTVSPGHRVSMAAAPELVMRFVRDERLPEPIRIARALLADAGRLPFT